jgi:hypothetical protein
MISFFKNSGLKCDEQGHRESGGGPPRNDSDSRICLISSQGLKVLKKIDSNRQEVSPKFLNVIV